MSFVLTLCADPSHASAADPVLTAGLADAVRRALGPLDCGAPDWLAPGVACDIACAAPDKAHGVADAHAAIAEVLGAAPIDAVLQPAVARRKRLLVADMEATIIENEMLEELADLVGLRAPVAEVTRRAMNGELDFAEALGARVTLLANLPETALDEAGRRMRIMPGASALVRTMRHHGAFTALVSGGFRHYTGRVARELGFDEERGNRLEIAAGKLTGRTIPPILGADAKHAALLDLTRRLGLGPEQSLAVGDGANDLPMLKAAGLGVAFHGKPAVAAAAPHRIDYGDLTALLYLQGYRRDEILLS